MNSHLALPADLTEIDRARISNQLQILRDNHGGNGFAGVWCEDTHRSFLAVVADGEISGWLLMPAANELIAKKFAEAGAALVEMVAQEMSAEARNTVLSVIKNAKMH